MFFGIKSIKDAWDLPSAVAKTGEKSNQESDEFVEAEELVKEKVNPALMAILLLQVMTFFFCFFII